MEHKERICFLSAARALGRLHHEGSAEAIAAALEKRHDLLPGDLDYAKACMSGNTALLESPQF